MRTREKQSEARHEKPGTHSQDRSEAQPRSVMGGREFGNVIEPIQAQMASGNQGLAAQPGDPAADKKTNKRRRRAA